MWGCSGQSDYLQIIPQVSGDSAAGQSAGVCPSALSLGSAQRALLNYSSWAPRCLSQPHTRQHAGNRVTEKPGTQSAGFSDRMTEVSQSSAFQVPATQTAEAGVPEE